MDTIIRILAEIAEVTGHASRPCAFQDDQEIAQAIFERTPESFHVAWHDGVRGGYEVFPTWTAALEHFCDAALDRAREGVLPT